MSRSRLIGALLVVLFVPSSCSLYTPPIVGTWEGKDHGHTIRLIFERDGTGRMEGRSSDITYRYEVDFSKKPTWLDFTSIQGSGGSEVSRDIIEFVDGDTMRIKTRYCDARPKGFAGQYVGYTTTLRRVK